MPKPKRRIFEIRQKQKRRDKARKSVRTARQIQAELPALNKIVREIDAVNHRLGHDLAGPQSKIDGMLEIALETRTISEKRRMIELARSGSKFVKKGIEWHARGEKFSRAQVAFSDFVNAVGKLTDFRAWGGKNKYVVESNINLRNSTGLIQIDEFAMQRMILNLQKNAGRATEKGLIKTALSLEKGNLKVVVSDTGTGMPKNTVDRFLRGERLTIGEDGHGVGLNNVRDIADFHGGKYKIETQKGKGTTITIDIPIRER